MKRVKLGVIAFALLCVAIGTASAGALSFNSTNFQVNGSIGDSVSGAQSSTNYKMTSSGGQSVIGSGASGSYKLGQGYTPQLDQSLQLNAQPAGLVAYYPLDDPFTKTVFDSSANSVNLETVGAPTQPSGKIGNAFSGSHLNSAQASDSTSLDVTNITAEAWLKVNNFASLNGGAVARFETTTQNGDWLLGNNGSTGFRFIVRMGGTTYSALGLSGKNTGQWYHVVGTYDGTNVKVYVDGALEDTALVSLGNLPSPTTPFSIGERANQTQPDFDGSIDEVKVFNRAFTDKEVAAEYAAQNSGIPAGVSLNDVTPGASRTAGIDGIIQTDAPGYTLSINQNNNLTSGGNTVPAVSGSIGAPVTWSEGSTKGLGFTLYGTNATAIPGSWGSGAAYAALPASATTFYTRTGYNGGTKDFLNMRLRLDVATSQPTGNYTNQMIITGTTTP